jgi:hypothetical protein
MKNAAKFPAFLLTLYKNMLQISCELQASINKRNASVSYSHFSILYLLLFHRVGELTCYLLLELLQRKTLNFKSGSLDNGKFVCFMISCWFPYLRYSLMNQEER